MMSQTEYSITRLLVMKKSVEAEVKRLLGARSTELAVTVKAGVSNAEKEKLKSRQKAFLDSLTAAMRKRDIIASAIAESNAKTTVVVNGKTLTVTSAIDRKNNIETEKAFCNFLSAAGAQVQKQLEQAERQIELEVLQRAQTLSGRDKAPTKEVLDLAKASVEDLYKLEVVEPVDLFALTMSKRTELDAFIEEIDIALNESNATTKVVLDLAV